MPEDEKKHEKSSRVGFDHVNPPPEPVNVSPAPELGEYPTEITKENITELVQKAKETKKKVTKVMLSTSIIYAIIGNAVLFLGLPLWGYFVVATSKPMSPEVELATVLVSFLIIYWLVLWIVLLSVEAVTARVFALSYKYSVFGECVLIVSHLNNNDKTRAVQEVDRLSSSIRSFLWNSGRNSRAKMLSVELNALENGATQVKRMLMFSTQDTVGMFTRFALAWANDQDREMFFTVKDIINEASLYGQMESFVQRTLRRIERYPTVLAIGWAVISTVISIVLAVLLKISI